MEVDASQTAIVSLREMADIKKLTGRRGDASMEASSSEQALRVAKKTLSQARYTHWPNTIEAQRQKKDTDRQRRLDQIEAAQQLIDERERDFRTNEKREAIATANRLLYQENDTVKLFRSAMLASNALNERQAQAIFKEEHKKQQQAWDKIHGAQIQASIQKSLDRENKEAALRARKAEETAAIRLQQLKDLQDRHAQERQEQLRESELLKEAAIRSVKEAQEAEASKRESQRRQARHYFQANLEARKMKEERALLEAAEDARIAGHAAEKERTESERKAVDEMRRKKRQDHFDGMISRQQELLSKIHKSEEERLEKQMAALQKRTEEKERAMTDHKARLLKDLSRGRQLQVLRQAQEQATSAMVEKQMAEEWMKMNEMLESQERELAMRERAIAKKLQEERRLQIEERHNREKPLRAEEVLSAKREAYARQKEDEIFEEFARHQIQEFEKQGKPTETMKVTLRNIAQASRRLQA